MTSNPSFKWNNVNSLRSLHLGLAILFLISLTSCAAADYQKRAVVFSEFNKVPENKARIIFVQRRSSGWTIDPANPIYDGNELIGVLPELSYFSYETNPGEHVFGVYFPKNYTEDYVQADLKGGKTYYIYIRRMSTFVTLHFSLIAAKKNDPELREIKNSLTTLQYAEINSEGIKRFKGRGKEIGASRNVWIEKVKTTGKPKLLAEDGE